MYDYLDMAESADNPENAKKFAKKVLALEKDNADAKRILILSENDRTPEKAAEKLEKLSEAELKNLEKQGISEKEDAGSFYGLFKTRPYMRIQFFLVRELFIIGKYRKAIAVCQHALKLNENDNLGLRYNLMSLYAKVEDLESAEKLYKEFEDSNIQMNLPLAALYYKNGDTNNFNKYVDAIDKKLKGFLTALNKASKMTEEDFLEYRGMMQYTVGSADEFFIAWSDNSYLYNDMLFLLDAAKKWVKKNHTK